jgi:hypothetical protein
MYASLDAMERLNSRPGFVDSLDDARPGRRNEFNSELAIQREAVRIMEEEGVSEFQVARIMAILAASGVTPEMPNYYSEYERIFKASQPMTEADRKLFAQRTLQAKADRSWWGILLEGAEEIEVFNPVTQVATPGLAVAHTHMQTITNWLSGLFGNTQTLPALDMLQAFDIMNIELVSTRFNFNQTTDIYATAGSTAFHAPDGQSISATYYLTPGNEWMPYVLVATVNRVRTEHQMHISMTENNEIGAPQLLIEVFRNGQIPSQIGGIPGYDTRINIGWARPERYAINHLYPGFRIDTKSEWLSLPAVPLVNNAATMTGDITDNPRDKYILPPIPMNPAGSGTGTTVDWGSFQGGLRARAANPAGTQSDVGTCTGTLTCPCPLCREAAGTCTGTLTCQCVVCKEKAGDLPIVGQGEINWPKLTSSWARLAHVFPFCLPIDLIGIFTGFTAPPRQFEPIHVNILPFLPGNTGMLTLDFNIDGFDMLLRIFRTGMLIMFAIGLIMATRGLITW